MDGLYFHHHQLVVGVEGQLQGKVWRKERLAFVWKKLFGECFLDLESMRKALLRLERRKAWGMFWLMKAGLVCFGGEVWAFRGLKIKRKTSILKKGVYFENRRLFWKQTSILKKGEVTSVLKRTKTYVAFFRPELARVHSFVSGTMRYDRVRSTHFVCGFWMHDSSSLIVRSDHYFPIGRACPSIVNKLTRVIWKRWMTPYSSGRGCWTFIWSRFMTRLIRKRGNYFMSKGIRN